MKGHRGTISGQVKSGLTQTTASWVRYIDIYTLGDEDSRQSQSKFKSKEG